MSDIEKELPEEEAEENENYITLTDDNGEDISFEVLDTVEYKDRLFAVLLPFDEEEDEVVILEIISDGDPENDDFVSVDDDVLLGEVYEVFKKQYEGDYDFE